MAGHTCKILAPFYVIHITCIFFQRLLCSAMPFMWLHFGIMQAAKTRSKLLSFLSLGRYMYTVIYIDSSFLSTFISWLKCTDFSKLCQLRLMSQTFLWLFVGIGLEIKPMGVRFTIWQSSLVVISDLLTRHNYGESKRCLSTYAWQNWQWKQTRHYLLIMYTLCNYAMTMTMTSTLGRDVT